MTRAAGGDDAARAAASDALHRRVRAFAREALAPAGSALTTGSPGAPASASRDAGSARRERFETLALDIARFQAAHAAPIARLGRYRGARLDELASVPAVPADAFRLGRVAAHPPGEDVATFLTSGTTGSGSGRHVFRTLETYAELCVCWGRRALLRGEGRRSEPLCADVAAEAAGPCTVLALAPPFEPERRSSLGYMMWRFMRELDGRPLTARAFDANEPGRWLLADGRVDVEGLRRAAAIAAGRAEPVLLLATSFALVWLLDVLAGGRLPLPAGSVVMMTGGFKGRSRSVDGAELGLAVCRALALEPRHLIGEYGMTELSSQLYDGGFDASAEEPSVFVEPPWLRVTPVDPISLEPVAAGEVGLARFTDLANVDSALVVLTRDLVRRVPGGIVLLGRQPGASLRGCSLSIESLAPWGSSSRSPGAGAAP